MPFVLHRILSTGLAVSAALLALNATARAGGGFCSATIAAPASGSVALTPPIEDVVLADRNMTLSPTCVTFAPPDGPSSYYGFVQLVRTTLDEGLACLAQDGVIDATNRLRAVLHPGSTPKANLLVCGPNGGQVDIRGNRYDVTSIASALTPGMPGYPGVIFNLSWIATDSTKSLKAALFHELFHTAGYDHEHNVDYAYFAAGCCFEGSAAACDLMRRAEGKDASWWTTADYLKDAIAWFAGREAVASTLLLSATEASPGDLRGVAAGILQLGVNKTNFRTLDDVSRQELAVRCLAAGGGATCLKAFPTTDPATTQRAAQVLALRYAVLARAKATGRPPELTAAESQTLKGLRAGLKSKCSDLAGAESAFRRIREQNSGSPDIADLRDALSNLCR